MLAIDPKATVSSPTFVNTGRLEIPPTSPAVGPDLGDPPAGFDADLWQLLKEVKAAGIPLTGKIAEYAGFYNQIGSSITTVWDSTSDNGVNPDHPQTGTSQPNKSFDKLTFLIIFQLPFHGEMVTLSPKIDNPGARLCYNRRIVKNADNKYVVGVFQKTYNAKGVPTVFGPTTHTITRSETSSTPPSLEGKDLFYDSPTGTYYVSSYTTAVGAAYVKPAPANFGDPLGASPTWSSRANLFREKCGLKRLNGAGEQVDSNSRTVDNDGNLVSFEAEPANAYSYYEIDFTDVNPGSAVPESVDDQSAIDAIKTAPLYYFLTVYTENKPGRYVQNAHFPEDRIDAKYANSVICRVKTKGGSGLTFGLGFDIGGRYVNDYVYEVQFQI